MITGATGFIGRNLVENLAGRYEVSCLIRRDDDFLNELGVDVQRGDVTDKSSLKISEDVDAVVHLAGTLGSYKTKQKEHHDIHVRGAENILKRCTGQRFIYISSAGVLGPVIDADETYQLNPTNDYENAKAEAEELVRQYENHIILRPEFVYGPHDMHVLRLFNSIKNRKFFLIGDGESLLHPTYVGDVVFCIEKCLNQAFRNQTFNIAGKNALSVREFQEMVANELGVSINRLRIPLALARAYVSAVGPWVWFDPVLTKSSLDFFTKSRTFNTDKAQKMLGYRPVSLKDGISKTIGWYSEHGYL